MASETDSQKEFLAAAVEAARRADVRGYFVNLAASHVLDGITRNLQRTDLEVHNPGTTQAGYTIALLKRNTAGRREGRPEGRVRREPCAPECVS